MQQPIFDNDPLSFSREKESYYFDRKSARKDASEIAKHISAFANAMGGKLVIGIEDNGEITGFKRNGARDIESFKQVAITECMPVPAVACYEIPVINSNGQEDRILVIDVSASSSRVISIRRNGDVFLRQQDRSVKLDREQVLALEYDKNQRSFEDEVCKRSSIEDVNPRVLELYKESLGTDIDDEKLLRSRGFLTDGCLTNAGVLLFAQNPTKYLPCARVRVLKYEGDYRGTGKRMNIVKDRTFDGAIPEVIEGAKSLISSQLREFQFLDEDGKFSIIPEYPEFAWFEGLVNAVTHRDYAVAGDYIRISLFDDRMEIQSPGALPNIVTLDNMKNTRYSRNPSIARALAEMGWVRELNEGVQRIYDEMQSFFLREPVYSEPNGASVLLTLENSATSRVLRQDDALGDSVGQALLSGLNEYELSALRYVYAKRRITVGEFCRLTDRSVKVARKTLRGLVDKGVLGWHGSNPKDPAQYYALEPTCNK